MKNQTQNYRVLVGELNGKVCHIVMSADCAVALVYHTEEKYMNDRKHPVSYMPITGYDGNSNCTFTAGPEDCGMIAAADLADEVHYGHDGGVAMMMVGYTGCMAESCYNGKTCDCSTKQH